MGTIGELVELSRLLKQERLFVSSEREQLQSLSEGLMASAQRLYHLSWITRQQRQNLDQLIKAERGATPEVCCRKANDLEAVNFVDGYKHLSHHEAKISECLKQLRESPTLVASCLMEAEKTSAETLQKTAQTLMTGLYGNAVMQEDESLVLRILKCLIDAQVAQNDNPRRLLRRGSCAFSVFFKLLNEGLFAAKLFLTAALHKPVMQLLMEDEWFYDTDPDRALYRFPAGDRAKRFGNPGTEEYDIRCKAYREMTNKKLFMLSEQFINSVQSNMYCFPQSLAWLVAQLFNVLTAQSKCSNEEARAICADLIFTFFICPAICDPEPFGITSDAPIGYIARHNLMQVAQILQTLAVTNSWDEIEPKVRDLYSKFTQGCMNFLLDAILDIPTPEHPPCAALQLQGLSRAAVFMTMTELLHLLSFLRDVHANQAGDTKEKSQLETLLCNVPSAAVLDGLHHRLTPNSTPQPTPPGTPPTSAKKLARANRGKDIKRLLLTPDSAVRDQPSDDESETRVQVEEDVLVISLGVVNEHPGQLSEDKVIEQEKRKKGQSNSLIPGEDDPISESQIHLNEKRTRFSLSHDQDSIATSDNLEAISEAASSHSVGSDDLDENEDNDNLSDFVSANVSGRGTPSISGRDTPLSQASEVDSVISGPQEEGQNQVEPQHQEAPRLSVGNLPVIVQKQGREDVIERFGKFEIKQELERDETKSTVSDTWSTDVLASDLEPVEAGQRERLDEVAEEMARRDLLQVNMPEGLLSQAAYVSETASDAWSTDVLASDTSEKQVERLLELEQDEMSSVSSRSQGVFDDVSSVGSRSQGQLDQEDVASVLQDETDEASSQQPGLVPRRLEELGAVGGPSRESSEESDPFGPFGSPNAITLRDVDRTKSLMKSDRFSDPGLSGHNSAFNEPTRARPTSQVMEGFNPSSGMTESFPQGSGRTAVTKAPKNGNSLGCSAQTLVPDGVTSPDQGLASSMESVTTASATSLLDEAHSRPDSGIEGVDALANDISEGLKLTECQNVKIDANRLSNFGMFDPLLQDAELEPIQKLRTTSESGTIPPPRPKQAFVDQGARPKVPTAQQNSAPRISVNDVTEGTRDRSNRHGGLSNGPSAVGVLVELDNDNGTVHGLRSSDGKTAMMADSSSSSSFSDGKDDDDKDKKKHTSAGGSAGGGGGSSGSFFRSFRERLSKGGYYNTVEVKVYYIPEGKGGKRKVSKLEKDDGKLMDPDKGGAGDTMHRGLDSSEDLQKYRSKHNGASAAAATNGDDGVFHETSDDILAKYRKPIASPIKNTEHASMQDSSNRNKDKEMKEEEVDGPAYDPNNLETCKAFLDAKKKLRLVLSTADFQAMPWLSSQARDNDLVSFLKAQLAESINLQDKDAIAQLHETIRCLRQFDQTEVKKLIKAMKDEYRSRSPYITYLVRCRQGLLSTTAHLERLHNRIHRDKAVVNKYFLSVFVRLFMEKRERQLMRFIGEFQRINMSDEKTALVEQFMDYMHKQMEQDPEWKAANERQVEEARLYIERNVMSHIYTHAMYPNGDGDIMRDQILHEHMRKLGSTLSPNHKDLRIPKTYHYECPWPAAQAEIYMINAYKTPKDKLQCVWKCSQTIMNLLRLANEKSVPAADDFMPVLIFVIIKANPPSLLSTVQYVNSFYEKRLQGEEQYWWVQFSSAIEFIKTMD